jgi:hypothetical protein
MTRPVRWADPVDQIERRQHEHRPGRAAMGRSTVIITCPFCHADIEAYAWSLAGGGKRCTCGVLHGGQGMSLGWKTDPDAPPRYWTRDSVVRADDTTVRGRVLDVLFGGDMLTVKWYGGDVETIPSDQVRPDPNA